MNERRKATRVLTRSDVPAVSDDGGRARDAIGTRVRALVDRLLDAR
jgi:hypothetical protein